ncbi:MAG TPA: hypothetical protein VK306_14460 [Acidimicrobiales bacterium]|nr:hypothetical protein [Acidimicrobiales bacterium]
MRSSRLNEHEVDDVLAGRRPLGRARPDGLDELVAVLYASREVEPAPPMSDELRTAIAEGQGAGVVGPTGAVAAATPIGVADGYRRSVASARGGSFVRPAVSVAAAAVLLVGLVLAATRPSLDRSGPEAAAQVGSAVGFRMRVPEDAVRLPGVSGSDAATGPAGADAAPAVPSDPTEDRATPPASAGEPSPPTGATTGTSTATSLLLDQGRDDHRGVDDDRDGDADGSWGGARGTLDAGDTRTWAQAGTDSTVDPAGEPTPVTTQAPRTGDGARDEPVDSTTPPTTVDPEARAIPDDGTTADEGATTSTTAPAPVAPEG